MTNIFAPTTEDNFQSIYENLKTMQLNTMKSSIEKNFKIYGEIFLDSMTTNSVFDIDRESNEIKLKRRIEQIEKTCERLYKREDTNNAVDKALKSLPAKLVTISAIGCFVIEPIRLIRDLTCNF